MLSEEQVRARADELSMKLRMLTHPANVKYSDSDNITLLSARLYELLIVLEERKD